MIRSLAAFRAELHANPELSGQESGTAARLAARLAAAGCEVATGVGGHGVVGVLRNGDGPTVLLRAELDALPVQEETGLSYASTVTTTGADGRAVPVFHACGHDVHLACLAGTAQLLAADLTAWRGTVLLVGQPAEETLQGAAAMLSDGLYDRFGRPDVALAQHVSPFPAGLLAHVTPGEPPTVAGAELRIVIDGTGGHPANAPANPVRAAAALVQRLDEIRDATVSVGSLHAGARANIVPDRAVIEAFARARTLDAVDRAVEEVHRHAEAFQARVSTLSRVPPGENAPAAAERARRAQAAALGADRVLTVPAGLACEDFPLYGVPSVYWYLGSASAAAWRDAPGDSPAAKMAALPQPHSPRFTPDPVTTLRAGVSAMQAATLAFLAIGAEALGEPDIMVPGR